MSTTRNCFLTSYPATYEEGIHTFALLFTRWMDLNQWSHPVLVSLARSALDGASWLHSSQISGLRHGKLISPGPRTFYAIAVLNKALWEYKHNKQLIPGTTSSNYYHDPFVIEEDGQAPDEGWWFRVFIGTAKPSCIDLTKAAFTTEQANNVSAQYGALIRKLMALQDYDPMTDSAKVIHRFYPAKDSNRVEALTEVLWNRGAWTPDQLQNELPAITEMSKALEGPSTEEELLTTLSK